MKKLIFSITIIFVMVFSLPACSLFGGKGDEQNDDEIKNDELEHVCTAGEVETSVWSEPTCEYEGRGYRTVYCKDCERIMEEGEISIETIDHAPDEPYYEPINNATCFEEGYGFEIVNCKWCYTLISKTETRIAKTDDHYVISREETVVEPTCILEGKADEITYCEYCGEEFSRESKVLEKVDHVNSGAVQENVVEATCSAEGRCDMVVYCFFSECKKELSRTPTVLPKIDHTPTDPVKENEIAPSCTQAGSYEEVVYCGGCGIGLSRKNVTVPKAHTLDTYGICVNCDPLATRGLEYSEGTDSCSLIGRGTFKGDKLIIPSMYNGKRINTINTDDFKNDSSLVSITLSSHIKSVKSGAFSGCYSLVEIIDKGSNSVKVGDSGYGGIAYYAIEVHDGNSKIGYNGFYFYEYCDVNYLVSYPGSSSYITLPEDCFGEKYEINKYAFYGRNDIISISIPANITNVGDYAFGACSSLSSITISDCVSGFGSDVFSGCPIETATVPVNCISLIPKSKLTSITVTGGETSGDIPDSAFKNCTSLVRVTVGKNVLNIGKEAFLGCTNLASVSICNDVMTIGARAFENCYRLVEIINNSLFKFEIGSENYGKIAYYAIEIHSGDSKIINADGYLFYTYEDINHLIGYVGNENEITLPNDFGGKNYVVHSNALRKNTAIKSLTIPDDVTAIGDNAFLDCSSLKSLTLHGNITSIGTGAFDNSPIETATIPAVFIPNVPKAKLKTVVITSGTRIDEYAFKNAALLTSVYIPQDMTDIENYAFSGCTSLLQINVDVGNQTYKTVDGNLYSKDGKKLIQYALGKLDESFVASPDTEEIGIGAFAGCVNLKNFTAEANNNLSIIGENAFNGCSGLASVTISKKVENINDSAFYNCSSLKTLTFEENSAISNIANNAFYGCPIKEATIPAFVISAIPSKELQTLNLNGGTNIEGSALFGCTLLTSVKICDSITTIGTATFSGCTSLAYVTVGRGVTSIGESAFLDCTALKNVYISDLAKWCCITFENKQSNPLAYEGNIYLNENLVVDLVIPSAVTDISPYAFYNCDSLLTVVVSDGVQYISVSAFENCDRIVSIEFPETLTSIGVSAFLGCYRLAEVINHSSLDIRANQDKYGQIGFYLSSIHQEESKIVNIDGYLFFASYNDTYLITYVGEDVDLVLPETCNSEKYNIRKNAFYGFDHVKSIVIPSGVGSVGESAFANCKFETVTLPISVLSQIPTCIKNLTINGGEIVDEASFRISTNGLPRFSSLESVTIGDSITSIEDGVFEGYTALKNVVIGNSVKSISGSAFMNCTSLLSIKIPKSVETVDSGAFYNCTALETVTFEENSKLSTLSAKTFYGCSSLSSVVMPKNITKIEEYAFYECASLKEVGIPNSVTTIGSSAFSSCKSLVSIVIPDNVTVIKDYAFYNCSALESVVIGSNVTRIEERAFVYCDNLKSVTFKNPQAWNVVGATTVTAEELSDPESAAKKLRGYYGNNVWTRA